MKKIVYSVYTQDESSDTKLICRYFTEDKARKVFEKKCKSLARKYKLADSWDLHPAGDIYVGKAYTVDEGKQQSVVLLNEEMTIYEDNAEVYTFDNRIDSINTIELIKYM